MALATNTTLGTIVLAGDLYGSDPSAPSLAPSGVNPGQSTFYYSMVVDTKGRTIHFVDYPSSTPEEIENIRNEFGSYGGGAATTTTKGVVQIGSGISVTNGIISISSSNATTSSKGVVQVGSGLSVTNGEITYSSPDTTTSSKGIVQIGSGINVTNGTISVTDTTTSSKGIVQIGSGLSVASGVLSYSIPNATTTTKGVVQIGSGLSVASGTISVTDATTSSKGLVQIGSGISVTNGVISYSSPDATTTTKGVVQISPNNGLSITNGIVDTVNATTTIKGLVSISSNQFYDALEINNGILDIKFATNTSKGIIEISPSSHLSISSGILQLTPIGLIKGVGPVSISNGVMNIPTIADATASSKGIVQIDSNVFDITNGKLRRKRASSSEYGVVKVGSGFDLTYSLLSILPITDTWSATTSTKGIVQVGSGLSITNGVLSASNATTTSKGIVQISPNNGLSITNGIVDTIMATTTSKGVVKMKTYNTTNKLLFANLPVVSGGVHNTDTVYGIIKNYAMSGGITSLFTSTATPTFDINVPSLSLTSKCINYYIDASANTGNSTSFTFTPDSNFGDDSITPITLIFFGQNNATAGTLQNGIRSKFEVDQFAPISISFGANGYCVKNLLVIKYNDPSLGIQQTKIIDITPNFSY